ncbi:general secretion pathway protein GspB [Marinimicrobium agarilyticum]|uniref:general secretion pathway protein GspB n=1 Tax=Marinimicrobium agarilyticum TaxID=306546 RepID=UPI00056155DC|nr:general secretion pathway protein GspB [Marinimicrobium agarilyticum]
MRSLLFALLAGLSMTTLGSELQNDPTRPLDYRVSRATVELSLNAILRGGERRLAVINGQRLREGETIANSGGIRVVRINDDAVVVGQSGRQWRLKLNNESVRR